MERDFIDREEELKSLNDLWRRGEPEFIVMYGRRRVGKTWLLKRFIRDKHGVYYLALPLSHDLNLKRMSVRIEKDLGLKGFSKTSFSSLYDLLYNVVDRVGFDKRFYIVIDEFTYWVKTEPRVLGELQEFIDEVLRDTKLFLVICGSLVGLMYRGVLSASSPLYGRKTGLFHIKPLRPWYVKYFLEKLCKRDRAIAYGLLGGIPYYLKLASRSSSIRDLVKTLFLRPGAPLLYEPSFILREEFREPHIYMSVLSAIAKGYNTPSKIADYIGIHRQHVSKYLNILSELGIIGRVVPLESKKGWYIIRDQLFRAWFTLIEPELEYIEAGEYIIALEHIMSKIDQYMGSAWEDIAYNYIINYSVRHGISFNKIGKYIHKGIEIDLMIINDEERIVYPVEIKWGTLGEHDVRRVLNNLYEKISGTPWRDYRVRPVIIASDIKYSGGEDFIAITLKKDIPI